MDQQINYRVNIDDANFQAKLTQMRASMDQTMMGGGGFGGGGGGGMGYYQRMGATMGMTGGNGMGMDYSGVSPVTYTPPSIAMTPHFGMLQVRQTFSQQLANSLGMGSLNPFSGKQTPRGISPDELGAISAKGLGDRVSDMASTGIMTGLNLAVGTVGSIVGAGIGTMIGGPAGTLVGGIMGGMGATKLIGGIEEGVVQNRAIQADLEKSSFRFITGGPDVDKNLGRGFNRNARLQAAEDLQRVADTDGRFNIKDMREIQNMGIEKGLFTGKVTDTESLNSETIKLKDTIKTITSTLHTSIKEAGDTLSSLKGMGIMPSDSRATQMVSEAETLGRMSGRTGQEMLAAGQAGASIFQGTGIKMSLGAEANMQNLMKVRKMLDQGTLSQESVAQMGGEEAAAQQMTAGQLSATQTQFGRTALLANFDAKTGGLRKDFAQNMMRGDAMSMLQAAASKSPLDIIRMDAHQEDIISKMSPAELAMIPIAERRAKAKTLIDATRQGNRHLTEEEAYRFVAKREGLSKPQIDADIAAMHTDNKKIAAEVTTESNITKAHQESDIVKDQTSVKALIGNKMDQMAHSQSNAIAEVSNKAGGKVEDLSNTMRHRLMNWAGEKVGIHSSDESKAMAQGVKPGDFRSPEQQADLAKSDVMTDTVKEANRSATQGATRAMSLPPSSAAPAANTQPQVGGDSSGAVLETQKHLKTMSDQLLSQYTQLINMQKELNALMMQGKK